MLGARQLRRPQRANRIATSSVTRARIIRTAHESPVVATTTPPRAARITARAVVRSSVALPPSRPPRSTDRPRDGSTLSGRLSERKSDLAGGLYVQARVGCVYRQPVPPTRRPHGHQPGRASRGAQQGLPIRLEGRGPTPCSSRSVACRRSGGRGDQRAQERARLDEEVPAEGPGALREPSDAVVGRRPVRDRLQQHLLLHPLDREAGPATGRTCPTTSGAPGTSSASPRRRRSTWAA